jgi:hypothetical protein
MAGIRNGKVYENPPFYFTRCNSRILVIYNMETSNTEELSGMVKRPSLGLG